MSELKKRGPGRPPGTGIVDVDDVLDTVLSAIAAGGYDGLSMRAIARAHRVSLGTIQHHFATKDVLWRAAVDHLFGLAERAKLPLESTDLAFRIRHAIDASGRYPGILSALLTDSGDGAEERLAYVADRFETVLRLGEDVIHARQREGLANDFEPRALLLLSTIGLGAIASAPYAVNRVFGYDITKAEGSATLAADLERIIGYGLYPQARRSTS